MELNELIFLGACSLYDRDRYDIRQAVKIAKRIWLEVIQQEQEELKNPN